MIDNECFTCPIEFDDAFDEARERRLCKFSKKKSLIFRTKIYKNKQQTFLACLDRFHCLRSKHREKKTKSNKQRNFSKYINIYRYKPAFAPSIVALSNGTKHVSSFENRVKKIQITTQNQSNQTKRNNNNLPNEQVMRGSSIAHGIDVITSTAIAI